MIQNKRVTFLIIFVSNKSKVVDAKDDPPILEQLENIATLENINTSPIEVNKLIRGKKIS